MEYEIKRFQGDQSTLEKITELQNIVYKGKHLYDTNEFKYWYLDNPMGHAICFNAFFNDEVVSHYACIPMRMKIAGRVVLGLLSMNVVTHPEHRKKGLFKKLATLTYEAAKEEGYEFVLGVANANSIHGFMKYFPFTFISKLDVKIGVGTNIHPDGEKVFSTYWDDDAIKWRCSYGQYYKKANSVLGKFKPFVHTFLGHYSDEFIDRLPLQKRGMGLHLNLYVGLGAKINSPYITVPKFIKHSPFNLRFMDLTGGKLPQVNKDNIFFQLIDFDVA